MVLSSVDQYSIEPLNNDLLSADVSRRPQKNPAKQTVTRFETALIQERIQTGSSRRRRIDSISNHSVQHFALVSTEALLDPVAAYV